MTAETLWDAALLAAWERAPLTLPARATVMREADVFDYLCWLGREWRGERVGVPRVHLATEYGAIEPHSRVFPRSSDRTFDEYYSRISTEYNASSALLYVRSVADFGDLAKEVDRALVPLWVSGLRWKHLEVELYVGRYDWTPIGIHREPCGNIHQIITGEKEMIVWRPHVLRAREEGSPRALSGGSPEEALSAGLLEEGKCQRLTARDGEAIYFPSGHWHVGVSSGLSVALDLALYGVNARAH